MDLRLYRKLRSVFAAALFLWGVSAIAQDLIVMSSGGFAAPYKLLAPGYEADTHTRLTFVAGASMGTTPTAIPARLTRDEPGDVVILARTELDSLAKKGLVIEGSQVDLVRSRIGMAVRAGAPVPDISTTDAFKKALLAAKSIAYSDSASGVYISTELWKRLGLEPELAAKSHRILGDPVGEVVARGDASVGFQQMSELKPVTGITVVGPIPNELQKITVFSAGIVTKSQHPEAARKFIEFLSSKGSCSLIEKSALEPVACSLYMRR